MRLRCVDKRNRKKKPDWSIESRLYFTRVPARQCGIETTRLGEHESRQLLIKSKLRHKLLHSGRNGLQIRTLVNVMRDITSHVRCVPIAVCVCGLCVCDVCGWVSLHCAVSCAYISLHCVCECTVLKLYLECLLLF